jgi:hypothetical protein
MENPSHKQKSDFNLYRHQLNNTDVRMAFRVLACKDRVYAQLHLSCKLLEHCTIASLATQVYEENILSNVQWCRVFLQHFLNNQNPRVRRASLTHVLENLGGFRVRPVVEYTADVVDEGSYSSPVSLVMGMGDLD